MAEAKDVEVIIEKPRRVRQRVVTFKIPEDELKEIEDCARRLGLDHRSEIIRLALRMLRKVACSGEANGQANG